MAIKVVLAFDIEVDGEQPNSDTITMAMLKAITFGVVTSEDYDGSEDLALLINSIEARVI